MMESRTERKKKEQKSLKAFYYPDMFINIKLLSKIFKKSV